MVVWLKILLLLQVYGFGFSSSTHHHKQVPAAVVLNWPVSCKCNLARRRVESWNTWMILSIRLLLILPFNFDTFVELTNIYRASVFKHCQCTLALTPWSSTKFIYTKFHSHDISQPKVVGNVLTNYSKIYLFTLKLPPWFEIEKVIDSLNLKGLLNLYVKFHWTDEYWKMEKFCCNKEIVFHVIFHVQGVLITPKNFIYTPLEAIHAGLSNPGLRLFSNMLV